MVQEKACTASVFWLRASWRWSRLSRLKQRKRLSMKPHSMAIMVLGQPRRTNPRPSRSEGRNMMLQRFGIVEHGERVLLVRCGQPDSYGFEDLKFLGVTGLYKLNSEAESDPKVETGLG